jgi:hypothetical protein
MLGLTLHVLGDAIACHIVCLLGANAVHHGSFLLRHKVLRIVDKMAAKGGHLDKDLVFVLQNRFELLVHDVFHICIENDFVSIVQHSCFVHVHVSQHKDFEFTLVLKVAIVDVNDTYEAAAEEGRQR